MGKFAKDSVTTTIIIILGFLLGTFTGMFVYPKLFAKTELGIYRYLLGWATLFSQFCSLGIGSAAIRTYYRLRDERSFSELNMLLLLIPMAALLLFVFILLPFSDLFLTKTLNGLPFEGWAVIGSLIIFTFALTYIKTYSNISVILKKSPAAFFVNEIVLKVLLLGAFLFYYFDVLGRSGFLFAISLVYLLQLMLILYIIRSYFSKYPRVMPTYEKAKPVLKLSMFCLVDSSASLLVAQIDLMMVGILCADSLVRIQEYGLAIQVAAVVYLPWRSFSSTSIPFIAEAFSRSDFKAIDNIYAKTSLNLTIFGMAVFTLIFASIDNIIDLIPDNYEIIKYPVMFIGMGKVIDMMTSVNGNIISLSPYYKANLYFSLIMVILLFVSNLILIPIMGITGSALGTFISMFVFNSLRALLLYNKYNIYPFHRRVPEVLVVMGLILVAGMFFPDISQSAFINLCARSAMVGMLMFVYLSLRKPSEDIERIRLKAIGVVWRKRS